MPEQRDLSYSESLVRPPANLNFLVWLILLGLPALLLFLIAGKEYEATRPGNIGSAIIESEHRPGS